MATKKQIRKKLGTVYVLYQRIKALSGRLDMHYCLANKTSPTYSDVHCSSSDSSQRIEREVFNIVELKDELERLKKDYSKVYAEVFDIIQTLSSDKEKLVLEMRYLHTQDFQYIADEQNYSISYVYSIHNAGIKHLMGIFV